MAGVDHRIGHRGLARSAASLIGVFLALTAAAGPRSAAAIAEFRRAHPCPTTGQASGACPGWQVDHVVPLCSGGADAAVNMQWLTVEAHKRKTTEDVRVCRTEPTARNYP